MKSKNEFSTKEISWLNITQSEADTKSCRIEISSFYIDSNWYRNDKFLLEKYFSEIEVVKQSGRVFKLIVNAKSIFEAINLLVLIALFTHVTNTYSIHTYIDDQLADKYGRILTNIDNVPYFVFYLFIIRTVKSPRQFNKLKPTFENYLEKSGLKANLVLESNLRQRLSFITSNLEKDISILDIGCGEFTYYKRLMSLGFEASYYAVDIDPQFEHLSQNIVLRYDENNLTFFNSLNEFSSNELVNILLTEVIEHNEIEDAKRLIINTLLYNFNKVIITTPNAEFNQFYNMETKFRHDDHHFEPTHHEFEEMIEDCILEMDEPHQYKIVFFQLGDNLNGIQPTQGYIITKI